MTPDESSPDLKESGDTEAAVQDKVGEETPRQAQGFIDVPDGGQGWLVVLGMFLFNIATWASNSAYAVYLAHYIQHNKFPNASVLDFAAIGGLAFGCGLAMAPCILYISHRTSVKKTIAMGCVFQFCGLMLAAFSTKLWQIYLSQGMLIGFGLAFIAVPSNALLPQWFRKKRNLAQALSSTGSGIGGIMFNLAIQAIITQLSLRWALIIQAIICASCSFVGMLLVRTRDQHVKPIFTFCDVRTIKTVPFAVMGLYIAFTLLGYVVMMYNLADFTKSLGYTARQGSIVSCMVSVGICFGRPLVGRLSDRFGPVSTSIVVHFLVALFCFAVWIPARNYSTAIGFALVEGSLMGSIWVLIAPITTRLFGLRRLQSTLGCLFWFVGAFGIISPVVGIKLRSAAPEGLQYSPTQYRNPAIYCGCCYFASSMALLWLRCYLLARDKVAEEGGSHEDTDELHIKVSAIETLRKVFAFSPNRKI